MALLKDNKSDTDSDCDISRIQVKHKRIGVLASSDEETEGNKINPTPLAPPANKSKDVDDSKTCNNYKKIIGSEHSDNEEASQKQQSPTIEFKRTSNFKLKVISASDIESDNDYVGPSDGKSVLSSKVISPSDFDSESEHENLNSAADMPSNVCREQEGKSSESKSSGSENDKEDAKKVKRKIKNRKSSDKIDKKLQIRSETQRLVREAAVNLPYHRPKQRSLREFLSRKKNHLNANALRLTSANMIHAWEEIDKNIKETAEFFKSESEEEDTEDADIQRVPQTEKAPCTEDAISSIPINVIEENSELIASSIQNLTDPPELFEKNDDHIESEPEILMATDLPVEDNPVNVSKEPTSTTLPETSSIVCDDVDAIDKTEKWLKEVAAFEKRENLRNRLQLSPSILNKVPTLSNVSNFIDLDDSDSEPSELKPGARQLMDRLFMVKKPVVKQAKTLKTTVADVDEAGQIQNVRTEVLPLTPTLTKTSDGSNPGTKLQKFRETLRNEIEAKWEEEFKKRCQDVPTKDDFEETVESDEDEAYEGECDESSDTESEPEEEDVEIKEKPRRFCEFGNSEAEESEAEDAAESEKENREDVESEEDNETGVEPENYSEEENEADKQTAENNVLEEMDCSLPAFQPGGGLLMGGSTLTQQTQPLPLQAYSPTSSPAVLQAKNIHTPLVASQAGRKRNETPQTPGNGEAAFDVGSSVKKNLFGATDNTQGDPDDPFFFVSGAFPDSVAVPVSSEFKKPSPSQSKLKRIIVMEDSDEDNDFNDDALEKQEEPKMDNDESSPDDLKDAEKQELQASKKHSKLIFSDESECSEGEEDPSEKVNEKEDSELSAEEKEEEVEYDSEENEVEKVRPGEFFEQEAELSESEWSGDEDERGLDALEAEAGDADVLDENQVADQLGRIHMRRLLDEDARDVRLLQELLFEDGDLHADGKGRDRKFRWKNLSGFDLNGEQKDNDGSDAEGDGDVDGIVAKLRLAKSQFLMQLQQEGKLESLEEENNKNENSVIALGRQLLQRLSTRTVASSTAVASKTVFARGSFLSKDEKFLKRLSRVATGGTDGPLGPSKSSNFVFAVQEKEVMVDTKAVVPKEGMKRKAVGCKETVKRAKVVFEDQPSLLDQLH